MSTLTWHAAVDNINAGLRGRSSALTESQALRLRVEPVSIALAAAVIELRTATALGHVVPLHRELITRAPVEVQTAHLLRVAAQTRLAHVLAGVHRQEAVGVATTTAVVELLAATERVVEGEAQFVCATRSDR